MVKSINLYVLTESAKFWMCFEDLNARVLCHLIWRCYLFNSAIMWHACSIGHLIKCSYDTFLGCLVLMLSCHASPNRIQQLVHRNKISHKIGIGIANNLSDV